ncbi:hypothetical protein UCD39_13530 [Nitrospirillum sp. BR 11752]|nr:hypothetical protein [Nitrospirillum sp. BR 11752]
MIGRFFPRVLAWRRRAGDTPQGRILRDLGDIAALAALAGALSLLSHL